MASPDANKVYDGLAQVAHAIRRSAALREAISISPPEATIPEMLRTADELAEWIRGSANEGRSSWKPPE